MIFILLSILTTAFIIVLFKLFATFKVNTFLAIVVNYLTAASFGFIISPDIPSFGFIVDQSWLPLTLCAGIVFISTFQSMAITTQKLGVSVATVASKMSVVIPVTAAFILYGDNINGIKILGLFLAIVAVILTSVKEKELNSKGSLSQKIILPAIVFIGSGAVDLSVNYIQNRYATATLSSQLLLSFIFSGAFIAGSILFILSGIKNKFTLDIKSIGFGVVLGLLNYLSIIFLMKAIESNVLQSSVLFPINNMSIVMISAAVGYFFFKEKISLINLGGIIIAIVAILLIMLS